MMANGPVSWSSKRQKITARSSAEAEIYATDECVKNIQQLNNIRCDLKLPHAMNTTPIYNDNNACVLWSHNCTSKGLRHIQIRENAVREAVQSKTISLTHIAGDINVSDILTKEDKDTQHYLTLRNLLLKKVPTHNNRSISHLVSNCP